jgi:methionyl-tRNA synthetase
VLGELLESIRIVARLLEPVMPKASRDILENMGLRPDPKEPWVTSTVWNSQRSWRVAPRAALFPRIEKPEEEERKQMTTSAANRDDTAKGAGASAANQTSPSGAGPPTSGATGAAGPTDSAAFIDFDTFREIRLVVATVLTAERVAGADRLLKLDLDLGTERRQVVSGIAEHFRPEDLPGKQVVLVANLKPAKIRGIDSQGMILVAQSGGKMTLLGPTTEIAPGAKIS